MRIFGRILTRNSNGAVAVYVAVVVVVLLMFTALAIDVGHLYGVRNELHNAADAGALAGARVLFDDNCNLQVEAARTEAQLYASYNKTGGQAVTEIVVETGHWSFTQGKFTKNDSTTQATWKGVPFTVLDIDEDYINAVRVQTSRSDTPSFFAKILGYDQFFVNNDAVAYKGFAGELEPKDVDQPIAICKDSITDENGYFTDCNMGRMLNSGGNVNTAMTAMWTNFTQPCTTANNRDMQDLTDGCDSSLPTSLTLDGIGTQNGVQDNILGNVVDCWIANADTDDPPDGIPDIPWPMTLPVVDCEESNTCAPYKGIVEVKVIWIHYKNDPITQMDHVPTEMEGWDGCGTPTTRDERFACWRSFVDNFNLQNADGEDPPWIPDEPYEEMYQKKNIYFLPTCTADIEAAGDSNGENFGICALYPKLVE